ncbi:hypothetical protein [Actinomadura latina]|uniref:Thiol:disulfide interchange protein DsbD N-terminal domain-containing protein n=1 Tax=Actinomadura latina TaxID=163603 RepID=A0A846YWF6_9ACTN|nr:hypothetical protein [Actinomadura latina]NKZ02413.1 hypothetical protein [Actinomadura latina]
MRWAALGAGLLLLACGCGRQEAPPASAGFTESGVEVSVTVSGSEVKAVFRPTRPGFHVYSVDMPDGGVDGLGIPTRVAVRGGLTASGRVTADKPVRMLDLPSLGVRLPVYPDGPVALSLPVERSGRSGEVVVSYGACSSGTCLAPVIDRAVRVRLA